jgi:hypothetical protein
MKDEVLTVEQKATNNDTFRHIQEVQRLLNKVIHELLIRSELHDQSKLELPEVETFTKYTSQLATSTYGSEEYHGFLKAMGPALAHHYAKNRHHPEFFEHGVEDMNLIDLIELLCDWVAAGKRHKNGDPIKSIEINQKRFGISDQLKNIFLNTLSTIR